MQSSRLMIGLLVAVLVVGGLAWQPESGEVSAEPTMVITSALRDPAPFDTMVEMADTIVLGTVSELGEPQYSGTSDDLLGKTPHIWTPVTLLVEEVLKGDVQCGDSLAFAQLGGSKDDTTSVFTDEAQFRAGEHVLLCLYEPTGLFIQWTNGNLYADEGKYSINNGNVATNLCRSEAMDTSVLVSAVRESLRSQEVEAKPH